ncbi:CD276 antigen-like [Thunnus maccoyii]|uniref:CD276 antigen-like n=1 Tax=Thunnus maccoyii TaxID=8240 RepID=UPI001C4C8565|nr:CD276 antigen-like [Thunnus maccoyii]
MTVEWARPDLNPRFVYVWRDGVELESKKHLIYKGRTSVSVDKLRHGDVSLKLSRVKLSDQGRYRCFIPTRGDSFIELVVGVVSLPAIVSINRTSSAVVLRCVSKGWHPEPEVFWLDGEGNLLSAGPTETVRGPDDLYTVSSRVTVEKRHNNNFTCRVQQNNINQIIETHIQISADFFTIPPSSFVYIIIGVIVLIIFCLCSLAFIFAWWKWKQQKPRTTQTMKLEPLIDGERD